MTLTNMVPERSRRTNFWDNPLFWSLSVIEGLVKLDEDSEKTGTNRAKKSLAAQRQPGTNNHNLMKKDDLKFLA